MGLSKEFIKIKMSDGRKAILSISIIKAVFEKDKGCTIFVEDGKNENEVFNTSETVDYIWAQITRQA